MELYEVASLENGNITAVFKNHRPVFYQSFQKSLRK